MAPLPKQFASELRTVTLFADASVCHQTGAAGWACWAKTDGHPSLLMGGALSCEGIQSNEAELMALTLGVEAIREKGWLPAQLMLQCDNMRPLRVIQENVGAWESRHVEGKGILHGAARLNDLERNEVNRLRDLTKGCKLIVRHIKGHSSGRGRYWVNRECDRVAKEQMRKKRAQYTGVKSNKISHEGIDNPSGLE